MIIYSCSFLVRFKQVPQIDNSYISADIESFFASYSPTYIILFFCKFIGPPIGKPSSDPITTKTLQHPPTNNYHNTLPPYPINQSATIPPPCQNSTLLPPVHTPTQLDKPHSYQQQTQKN